MALIDVYSSTKKEPFVRRKKWINSFSSLVLGNRLVLTALVIEWMQDLGDDTETENAYFLPQMFHMIHV